MNSQLQASYQRIEASLQRLTDSIAAYNPSVIAAEELVAADEAVNRDIKQLVTHQQNYLRLEELRRTSNALDEQIKNTISLLADTRKSIQAIPSSETTDTRREVKIDELLSYAKFIAPTTVPPTPRKPLDVPTKSKDESVENHVANGIPSPPQKTLQNADDTVPVKEEGRAVKELEEKDKAWLIPQNLAFDPWPSGETMKLGALGKIQKMLEEGKDPGSVLTAEEQAEADRRRKEEEEQQRLEEEERQRKAREEWGAYGGPSRRQTVVGEPFNPDDL